MDTRLLWTVICILATLAFVSPKEHIRRQVNSDVNRRFTPGAHSRSEANNNGRLIRETRAQQNARLTRETNSDDPRVTLGGTGIGPSFRSKRDEKEMVAHAVKAEVDALAAAAENVAAEENSIAAAVETEEARQSLVKLEHSHSHTIDEEEDDEEEPEETESANSIEKVHTSSEPKDPETTSNNNHPDSKKEDPSQQSSSEASFDPLSSPLEPGRDSHLKKLMSESSDLAKELRMVFDILAKRESQLVEEMEHLKTALTGAVSVLKKSDISKDQDTNSSRRFRREHATAEAPYKACVYIESSQDSLASGHDLDSKLNLVQGYQGRSTDGLNYPPEPIVREFIPPDSQKYASPSGKSELVGGIGDTIESSEQQEDQVNENASSGENDVDLSKVYWLKLPDSADDETVRQKVQAVFSEVTHEGKDAIIIPVSRGFSSSQEVSRGFLKAVKVNPSTLKSRYSRKLRSLKIREVRINGPN